MGMKFKDEVGLIAVTVDKLVNERLVPLLKELEATKQELEELKASVVRWIEAPNTNSFADLKAKVH